MADGLFIGSTRWLTLLFPVGLWVLAFLYFALRSAAYGMPRTARIDKISASPYLPRIFMEFGYWMFTLPIDVCLKLGLTADMVTVGSMVFTALAALAFGAGHFALGGWTLILAFSCDAWDGMIARRMQTSSAAGEFFDATIDRYNDAIAFFGFMYYYRDDALPLLLGALGLVGSTVASYARAKGESIGIDPNVGWMQRHERAVYLGMSTVVAPLFVPILEPGAAHPRFHVAILALGLVAILTNVTAVWRTRFVLAEAKRRSS
jgi:CDP-diacylglycerol--glycerol-3-phosphate 3-phosphatidyltransferase